MDHVSCKGSESSLWHCQAQHGKNIQCSKQPYVVCSGEIQQWKCTEWLLMAFVCFYNGILNPAINSMSREKMSYFIQ